MIECRDVSFGYRRDRPLFHGVTFQVPSRHSLALVGPSGIGKTTLLRLLAGQLLPLRGQIFIGEECLNELPARRRRATRLKQMGIVFQDARLISELTVMENVMLPAMLTGVSKRAARSRAQLLLSQVDVDPNISVPSLSGGQARRVAVARSLINQPQVILADEPTASLDAANAQMVTDLLLDYCIHGGTLVVSTHEQQLSSRCDATWKVKATSTLVSPITPDALKQVSGKS